MEKTALDQKRTLSCFGKFDIRMDKSRSFNLEDFHRRQLAQRIQRFTIRGEKDQVVRGEKGVELNIPALSFVDPALREVAVGEINLELVELPNTTDMMLTRRPTTSNGELLESGGAFAFSARQYNQSLQLANPVRARVPVSPRTTRPDLMSVFTGPLRSSQPFDWSPSPSDEVVNPGRGRRGGYYELQVTRPQWINCDYFLRRSQSNIEFTKITAAPDRAFQHQEAFLLFKDINAVAMMRPSRGRGYPGFSSPKGYEALIAIIAMDGEHFFFGTLDINTSEGPHFTVPLEFTTQDEIQERVSAITGV